MNRVNTGYRQTEVKVDRLRSNQKRGPVESLKDPTGNFLKMG